MKLTSCLEERRSRRVPTFNLKLAYKDLENIASRIEGPIDLYKYMIESKRIICINIPPTLIRLTRGEAIFLKTHKNAVKVSYKK